MKPPKTIPKELIYQYTMFDKILISYWYFDSTLSSPITYSKKNIELRIQKVKNREYDRYGRTDAYLYSALEKYPIQNKSVAIIGSTSEIYESICLAYGGMPTTIEYNKRYTDHPDLTVMTVAEYERSPVKFDMAISISSIEHDGLGRYGDPLNPNGDIIAMHKIKQMLKFGGILYLAVPIGKDMIVWNAHRVYGEKRLPLLIGGWNCIDAFGFDKSQLHIENPAAQDPKKNLWQPVFVLKNTYPG
ncbi:protein containing DUF268 [Candidatus Magnetomorum sp. HK-1]|nr:protein containing DUF268 [Candidatus Magnetomorum sp. HK-1]